MCKKKIENHTDLNEALINDLNDFRAGKLAGKDLRITAYTAGKAVSVAKTKIAYDHHMRTVTKQKFWED